MNFQEFLSKTKWLFKQLFPLTYHSVYRQGDKQIVHIWKMWMGRCYKSRKWEVVEEITDNLENVN